MGALGHSGEVKELVAMVVGALDESLRRAPWKGSTSPVAGHCYVACEALHHLTQKRLKPCFVRHEGAPHWFLRDDAGNVVDPTAAQFSTVPDYSKGVRKGFLTVEPSKRSQVVIGRVAA